MFISFDLKGFYHSFFKDLFNKSGGSMNVFLNQRVGPLQVGQKTNIFRTVIATINRELRSWPLNLIHVFLIFNEIKKLEKDSSNRHL